MYLAVTKKLYRDKKKKMIEKSHLRNACYGCATNHKVQRVHEIPWRNENQDWLHYSSAFSDLFSELFCSENKENVCFILVVSAGDFFVYILIFIAKLSRHVKGTHLLRVLNKRPSGVMKMFCLVFEQTMATSSAHFCSKPFH